jgi:hypothetical protein
MDTFFTAIHLPPAQIHYNFIVQANDGIIGVMDIRYIHTNRYGGIIMQESIFAELLAQLEERFLEMDSEITIALPERDL